MTLPKQRYLELFLPFHIDTHGIVFQMRIGIRRHDVERVKDLVHDFNLR